MARTRIVVCDSGDVFHPEDVPKTSLGVVTMSPHTEFAVPVRHGSQEGNRILTQGSLPNIAFAGLTAAGKTTHAKRLAAELGYQYISATELLLEILGIDDPSERVWRTRLAETNSARSDGTVDTLLEERLLAIHQASSGTLFDTWALAWIGSDPLVRVWIESDLESRVRKCLVSQGERRSSPQQCRTLLEQKDGFNRRIFRERHRFDLFTDRQNYDVVLCNSHLIPDATESAARSGIDTFGPIVRAAVIAVLAADQCAARALARTHPQEVQRINPWASPAVAAGHTNNAISG